MREKLGEKFSFKALSLSLILAVSIIFLGSTASAQEWTFYEGESFNLDEANSEIYWGEQTSFNSSGFKVYGEALEINRTAKNTNINISIKTNSSKQLNTSLEKFNLQKTPDMNDTIIKIDLKADSNSKLDFRFSGVPEIEEGFYNLYHGDSLIKNFSSGGSLIWSLEEFNDSKDLIVSYGETDKNNQTDEDDDGIFGEGNDSEDEEENNDNGESSGSNNENKIRTHSFENKELVNGIKKVYINAKGVNISLDVRKLETKPDTKENINIHSIYRINPSVPDSSVDSATVQLEVDEDFVEDNKNIVIKGYKNKEWESLDTTNLDSVNGKEVYEAATGGDISYYAVQGVENNLEVTEGDKKLSSPNKLTKEELKDVKQEKEINIILMGAIFFVVVLLTTLIGYYYYKRKYEKSSSTQRRFN